MIRKDIYICEVCKSEWDKEEEALRCENSHCKPEEIIDVGYRYRSEIPNYIKVKMSNGEVAEYRN